MAHVAGLLLVQLVSMAVSEAAVLVVVAPLLELNPCPVSVLGTAPVAELLPRLVQRQFQPLHIALQCFLPVVQV